MTKIVIGEVLERKTYIFIFLGFLVFLSYFNTLFNPFIWDDKWLIVNNPGIQVGWQSVLNAFSPKLWGLRADHEAFKSFYRPLHTLLSILDYQIWGLNPFGYHLSNTILHLLNTILVYLFALRLTDKPQASLLAASLFAVHPVHAESVSFISARPDLLCSFFLLSSLHLYITYRKPGRIVGARHCSVYYILSLMFFGLSLFSKEMAISLPVLISVYAYIYEDKGGRIKRVLPFYAVLVLYIFFRVFSMGSFLIEQHRPRLDLLTIASTASVAVFDYIRLLLVPYPLKAYYTIVWYSAMSPRVILALVLLSFSGWGVVWLWRRGERKVAFFLLWTFISLAPVLNIGSLGEHALAERYLYIPSIGFSIFLSMVIMILWKRKDWKALPYIAAITIVVFAGLTIQRNRVWGDDLTFYRNMVRGAPRSPLPHANLAFAYERMADKENAIKELESASALAGGNHLLRFKLGTLYIKVGRLEDAVRELQNAIELKQDYVKAHNSLAIAYAELGFLDDAIREFQTALELKPDFREAASNLERAYRIKEEYIER